MDLFLRFKKDYFNYLISIILPALISGISIPVFKHLLGAKGYGKFSIWLNAILIVTAISSGWITQSILRLFPGSGNKPSFFRKAVKLSAETQLVFFIPVFLVCWFISKDIFLTVLCSLVLLTTSLQFTILAITQSSFLSRKIITSESIRIFTYVGLAIMLLKLSGISYMYSLFIAVFVSYAFSLTYLIKQVIKFFKYEEEQAVSTAQNTQLFKSFLKYGAPLSFWFVFTYLFSYIDKLFMFKYLGAEAQGNYQAIFDLIYKSITLIISPVITSIFPILTAAYEKGNKKEIRTFVKKIVYYELGGFVLTSILYWTFGAKLLLFILKTPDTLTFRLSGFIVICGTFVWQLAILAQKRFELKLNTLYLLLISAIAFIVQLSFYVLLKHLNNPLIYPFGFLLSAVVYLFIISFTELISFSRAIKIKILTK